MELRGSLKNFPLPDIIQLIGMGRRSGVLKVSLDKDEEASIFFDAGQMTHAEYGSLEGASVIYKLFKKQDGNFQFASGISSSKRSIQADWMTIVMEAARRYDEEENRGGLEQEIQEEPQEISEPSVNLEEIKAKLGEILNRHFGKKAKKIIDELDKVEAEEEKLLDFCNKAEKYIFVFIDNRKARNVSEEMRKIVRVDRFA